MDFEALTPRIIHDHQGVKRIPAVDCCSALDYSDPATAWTKLKSRNPELASSALPTAVVGNDGKTRSTDTLDLAGVTLLCMLARTERAADFRGWASRVLAQTIEHGFAIPQTLAEALRLAADSVERAEAAEKLVQELLPRAEFADRLSTADGWVDVATCAKELRIPGYGPKNIWSLLAELGFVHRHGDEWVPAQSAIEANWFRLDTRCYDVSETSSRKYHVISVSPRGVEAIYRAWARKQTDKQERLFQ